MKYKSVFDIIGPVMIGPSSSHTAGAARIGRIARNLFRREPKWATISFYGSFAKTYKGHGTDVAIVGGILDYDTYDERIIESINVAKKKGIKIKFQEEDAITDHPNTARIRMGDDQGEIELVGISIGGGKVEIIELNGFELKLSGHHPAILVVHDDRFGAIASVSNVIAKHQLNIGHMDVSRKEKGQMALMTIEVDQPIDEAVINELTSLPNITQVTRISD
ncbi:MULTISPECIES: L-serine ammonia-lyase, iron-sulfur-dependent subunit beta [unclassified Rossellomorea]|jgi:L-serine dehydratase|uniref:L-serine ammonia-lyase, iron-sulfur-dependent subunit beta n=1 Tax=unclassified Rossellomorea TaxID=2837526 RepID=UPI0009A753C5|nr:MULTISPECIES: L-serine ammonia-lyase, iron-sulfur-dependent subunit beta [unclassified Rossellomorea]OXS63294.1 L-serine ammonia-lyase, iron-sulfur-dependent, subunit beta [Bacillus sp. DSM 27956]PRX78257.1 L-serine dehydratase [Bacillus sp. V-88]UTE75356.1 L-serine ammonia-lyase, iron-sulfur-dependent subunit beta [Rossellomorea sp. KS-H15a]WGG47480.1 L-serine ammonia-lyase, iron-sulfur-dependent subunit beta [Rossellomorea sp. DA94]SLK17398.1 L-serine dehydratase [Bacillus sp. V-88]